MTRKVVIVGAAGRDFHNFNTLYRSNPNTRVVAFTAAQIPNIDDRRYPPELAGPGYPDGVPIRPEEELEAIVRDQGVDQVDFSYSDVSYVHVMRQAARALAAGADFQLIAPRRTQIPSRRPVVSVCAVRTGCGKSQTARALVKRLQEKGHRVVALRHPMPYGDLVKQAVQRFAEPADLDRYECTVEEREEYEQYIRRNLVIYAGVDYERIVEQAEQEADILLWDGGNNDSSFVRPDLEVTVVDPLREGHERLYYPGEVNFLRADVIVINKVDRAEPEAVARLRETIRQHNPSAEVIEARSEVVPADPDALRGKRVLVVEDGPTLTHGEMSIGAGFVAAERFGAAEIVDPRPYARGALAEAYDRYPHLGRVLPALGYFDEQLADLEASINAADCDAVVLGTPMSLDKLISIEKPTITVDYRLEDAAQQALADIVDRFLAARKN